MGTKVFTFGDIRIREVKGKYYVYIVEKDERGQRRDRYVGPLDKVINCLRSGGVGVPPTEVAGLGFEPRSQGPKPWIESKSRQITTKTVITNTSVITEEAGARGDKKRGKLPTEAELIAFYHECVKKVSVDTCKTYVNYLRKPLDVNNKQSVLAWKKYYKWKGDIESWKKIKTKKSGVDLRVPSEAEVRDWLAKVRGTRAELLFRLLLESGVRLTEAVKVLSEYDPSSDASENTYYIYVLNWSRGSKRAFYVFHVSPLQRQSVTYNYAKKLLHQLGIEPKYIRKFVATKMLELGIPAEVVDFLEGRTPSQILTKHYLDLLTLAKKYYPVYAEWLRRLEVTT